MTKTGTIIRLMLDRGFGFIRAGDEDLFFHVTTLDEALEWDERLMERRVAFDLVDNYKGPKAVNIRAAD